MTNKYFPSKPEEADEAKPEEETQTESDAVQVEITQDLGAEDEPEIIEEDTGETQEILDAAGFPLMMQICVMQDKKIHIDMHGTWTARWVDRAKDAIRRQYKRWREGNAREMKFFRAQIEKQVNEEAAYRIAELEREQEEIQPELAKLAAVPVAPEISLSITGEDQNNG